MPIDDSPPPTRSDGARAGRSGSSRPLQGRAQVTQAAIIHAAATVFAERGYARTTLDLVAAEAGVTKGALYFHFASKHDLANAVIAAETRFTAERSRFIIAEGGTGLEILTRLHRDFTRHLVTDVLVVAGVKLTTEELVVDLEIARPYASWGGLLEQLVEKACQEGDVRSDLDPAVVARYLMGAFTGVQIVSNSLTGRADLFDRVRQMWELALVAIVPPERLDGVRELSLQIAP